MVMSQCNWSWSWSVSRGAVNETVTTSLAVLQWSEGHGGVDVALWSSPAELRHSQCHPDRREYQLHQNRPQELHSQPSLTPSVSSTLMSVAKEYTLTYFVIGHYCTSKLHMSRLSLGEDAAFQCLYVKLSDNSRNLTRMDSIDSMLLLQRWRVVPTEQACCARLCHVEDDSVWALECEEVIATN